MYGGGGRPGLGGGGCCGGPGCRTKRGKWIKKDCGEEWKRDRQTDTEIEREGGEREKERKRGQAKWGQERD